MPGEENFKMQENAMVAEGDEAAAHPDEHILGPPEPFEDADERSLNASHDDAPEESATHESDPEDIPLSTKKWFILHTYSGFEEKVRESLLTRGEAFGFADQIGQILIPKEDVIELRKGVKVTTKRLVYPGYVLVEMEMNDDLWHRVKETPRVTGFLGGGNVPTPLTADEVNSILYRQQESHERPRPKMTFEKNENVRIVDGPFTNFSGKVDEINSDRNTLRVLVTIFGRATPVELDFLQVEKA